MKTCRTNSTGEYAVQHARGVVDAIHHTRIHRCLGPNGVWPVTPTRCRTLNMSTVSLRHRHYLQWTVPLAEPGALPNACAYRRFHPSSGQVGKPIALSILIWKYSLLLY